jgi:hypothetical protein
LIAGVALEGKEEINGLVLNHVPPNTYPGATGEVAEAAELL